MSDDLLEGIRAIEDYFTGDPDAIPSREQVEGFWKSVDELLQNNGVLHGLPITEEANGHKLVGHVRDDPLSRFMQPNRVANQEYYQSLLGEDLRYRNHWHFRGSRRSSKGRHFEHGCIVMAEDEEGRIQKAFFPDQRPSFDRVKIFLESGAARLDANLVSAERRARGKLFSMIDESQQMQYELNDAILEVGKSGVYYWVRKGRPTLAMRVGEFGAVPITALCLHPMGYYESTFAGALVPTDEMVAHLLYIRADEHGFWKRANHINIDWPQSGV